MNGESDSELLIADSGLLRQSFPMNIRPEYVD